MTQDITSFSIQWSGLIRGIQFITRSKTEKIRIVLNASIANRRLCPPTTGYSRDLVGKIVLRLTTFLQTNGLFFPAEKKNREVIVSFKCEIRDIAVMVDGNVESYVV